MSNSSINIILADDHEIFRDGFASFIHKCPGINLVGAAVNGTGLIQLTENLLPDVILTDIIMPVMDGIEATRQISKKFPSVGIIGFSMFNEDYLLKEMLEAGATGFLLKNAQKEEVIASINSVHNGLPFFCADTAVKLAKLNLKSLNTSKIENQFTEKEKKIILFICQGFTNKKMAKELFLSGRTIEGYRERIMQKSKATNPAELAIFAIANNIIFLDENGLPHPCLNPPLVKFSVQIQNQYQQRDLS